MIVFSVADFRILRDLAQPETTGGLDGIGHFLETILPAWTKEFTITLRYLTKQAEIPTESGWAFSVGRQTPSPVSFPIPSDTNVRHVSKYELATAITQEAVVRADEERTKAIPVHHSLLLDSIHAYREHDFRRSILFSAIAMETYATGALEDEYNKVIESRVSPDHLRVSEFAVGGGEHQTKDPVYSYISEKTRNEFAPLLHELPLYFVEEVDYAGG